MPLPAELIGLTERPIAFQAVFARIAQSAIAGLFMSQAVYWQPRATLPDGWWWKTREQWAAETHLSRSEQESARKIWRRLGVLSECRRGVPARVHYRVDLEQLAQLIRQLGESCQLEGRSYPTRTSDTTNRLAGKPPSSPETTPQTTSETPSGSKSRAPSARNGEPDIKPGEIGDEEILANPLLQGVVAAAVDALREVNPPRDLRAWIRETLLDRDPSAPLTLLTPLVNTALARHKTFVKRQ